MDIQTALNKLTESTELIQFATTPARAFVLLGNIQLALRHPGNNGESAGIAREIGLNLQKAICAYVPEVEPLIEMGWDSSYDVTSEEYEALALRGIESIPTDPLDPANFFRILEQARWLSELNTPDPGPMGFTSEYDID